MREVLLKVEHLCQNFGKVQAVRDVSFEIYKGEVFGLVGESGCGKTTTGRCIIGLYPTTGGEIWFEDRRLAPARRGERTAGRENAIQMIFQDPMASLDPRMTIREIIAEGLIIRGSKNREEIRQQTQQVLEMVGLRREYADRYPHEFSGGQRQRIGIARAIIMQPKLLIADEPVSALDVSIQAQVINLLNDLRRRMDLSILFVAHDLSVVKYFSDRIGVMYLGQMVELAPTQALFAHPLHPYTQSLLSAIPLPDPRREKERQRMVYEPARDFAAAQEKVSFREVAPGHWVLCNEAEYEKYRKIQGIW